VVDGVNTSPVLYFVHVDYLNRPIKMTDAAKAQAWDAVWAPWGSPHAITGPAALDARFPGQWFQLEAGLHYNWHRHYDASLGRYTQPDPLGFVDGPSVYGYTKSNPVTRADPEGRTSLAPSLPGFRPPITLPRPFSRPSPLPMTPWTEPFNLPKGLDESWGPKPTHPNQCPRDNDYCRNVNNYCIFYCTITLVGTGKLDLGGDSFWLCKAECNAYFGCGAVASK
jgi:RHS repeat-associated protein